MSSFQEKLPRKFRSLREPGFAEAPDKEILLQPEDILDQLLGGEGSQRLLGVWSEERIRQEFERHGVWKRLQQLGFRATELRVDTMDPYEHRLTVVDPAAAPDHPLIEIILHSTTIPRKRLPSGLNMTSLRSVLVEWMLLQNPLGHFSEDRPRLPGQRFPGLGLSRQLFHVLYRLAGDVGVHALLVIPGHYHNAVIFSRRFHYLRPESEARLRCYVRDLGREPLARVSWAFELGCVRELESGKHIRWFVDWQAIAVDEKLETFFRSEAYQRPIEEFVESHHYEIDEKLFKEKAHLIDTLADLVI
jgi:hypothetical protein